MCYRLIFAFLNSTTRPLQRRRQIRPGVVGLIRLLLERSISTVLSEPDLIVTSDASGSWGCGAFWDIKWFQLKWVGLLRGAHIAIKELVPNVIAIAIWGNQWQGKVIQVLSDNAAVITAINKNTTRLRESAHLLWCLAFICASFQCQLRAAHIPGPIIRPPMPCQGTD